jgi:hypothetical protein
MEWTKAASQFEGLRASLDKGNGLMDLRDITVTLGTSRNINLVNVAWSKTITKSLERIWLQKLQSLCYASLSGDKEGLVHKEEQIIRDELLFLAKAVPTMLTIGKSINYTIPLSRFKGAINSIFRQAMADINYIDINKNFDHLPDLEYSWTALTNADGKRMIIYQDAGHNIEAAHLDVLRSNGIMNDLAWVVVCFDMDNDTQEAVETLYRWDGKNQ